MEEPTREDQSPAKTEEHDAPIEETEKKKEPLDLIAAFLYQPAMNTKDTITLEAQGFAASAAVVTPKSEETLQPATIGAAPVEVEAPSAALDDAKEHNPMKKVEGKQELLVDEEVSSQLTTAEEHIEEPKAAKMSHLSAQMRATRASEPPTQTSPQPKSEEASVIAVEAVGAIHKIEAETSGLLQKGAHEGAFDGTLTAPAAPFSLAVANEARATEPTAPVMRATPEVEATLTGSSRVQLVVGEGKDQVTLLVSARENQVRVVAQSASGELLQSLKASAQELQTSLQQHGLNLSHFGSGSQPQQRPREEREALVQTEGPRLTEKASQGKRAGIIA